MESPEVAKAYLDTGNFTPDFASDVWQFGLLILQLLQARMPEQHCRVLTAPAFLNCHERGADALVSPGYRANLQYLADALDSDMDYASQVCYLSDAMLDVLTTRQSGAVALPALHLY